MHLIDTRKRRANRPARVHVRHSSESAIRYLADSDLEELRLALRRTLCDLTLGSPASQIVGRLSRLARAEQRRRERQRAGPAEAA